MASPFLLFGRRCYCFCPLLSGGGTPDGKLDSFTAGAARFSFRYHRSRIILDRSCRRGSSRCSSCLLSFIWFCLGKPEGLSGVLSFQAASVHGGWKPLLPPEPKPVPPQFPIRNLSPFPDGWGKLAAWLVFLLRGICMMSEIFRLLCSNRAFMDRSRPFGCFRKLSFAAVLPCSSSALSFCKWSVCGFLPMRSAVRLWQFGSGSRWK